MAKALPAGTVARLESELAATLDRAAELEVEINAHREASGLPARRKAIYTDSEFAAAVEAAVLRDYPPAPSLSWREAEARAALEAAASAQTERRAQYILGCLARLDQAGLEDAEVGRALTILMALNDLRIAPDLQATVDKAVLEFLRPRIEAGTIPRPAWAPAEAPAQVVTSDQILAAAAKARGEVVVLPPRGSLPRQILESGRKRRGEPPLEG